MNKIKKLYNKNRVLFILTIIVIIGVIIIMVGLLTSFYGSGGANKYGNRLEGVKNVKITNNFISDLESEYKADERVKNATISVSGKIIYVIVEVIDATSLLDAQGIAIKGLEKFTDEEKAFYDIQFIVNSPDLKETTQFPSFGYKNATSASVVWTRMGE